MKLLMFRILLSVILVVMLLIGVVAVVTIRIPKAVWRAIAESRWDFAEDWSDFTAMWRRGRIK